MRDSTSLILTDLFFRLQVAIEKGSAVTVVDNSGRVRWRVRLGGAGTEVALPGAVLALPPPAQEAIDAADALRKAYDRVSVVTLVVTRLDN